MPGIYILAENRDHLSELLNMARSLSARMRTKVSLFLCFERENAQDYIACGADEILILPALREDQSLDAYVPVIIDEIGKADPDLFLIAATFRGREIAARIAGSLNAGLCSGCTAISFNPESKMLEMESLAYGGAAVQKLICSTRAVMATVPPGTFESAKPEKGRAGEIRELPIPPQSQLKVIERKVKRKEAKDITEAHVVVCPGRGLGKREDLSMVKDLADLLGGEIGCSRPLSEEFRWLPEKLCIGLSGVTIKPDLYVGIGVSGQVQHVTGIRNSKVIAAINKDENAPIFGVADYGIVGDLYNVIPKMIQALKEGAGS